MADTLVDSVVETQEVSTQETPVFPVYLVHSRWSLTKLDAFLSDFGDVGYLRIVYDNAGSETDRTIAVLPQATFDELCNEGYDRRQYGKGFVISPFLLKDNNFPGEGRTKTLFVPVPKNLSADDETVVNTITDKLKHLAEWGIVPVESWSVNAPLKSREKGGIRGGCFISFKRDVPLECLAMVRVLLTDTYWPEYGVEEERAVFRCFWARDRKDRTKGPKGDKGALDPEQDQQLKEARETRKREAIQKVVKKAKPVKGQRKKAPTVPVAVQPTLKVGPPGPTCCSFHKTSDIACVED